MFPKSFSLQLLVKKVKTFSFSLIYLQLLVYFSGPILIFYPKHFYKNQVYTPYLGKIMGNIYHFPTNIHIFTIICCSQMLCLVKTLVYLIFCLIFINVTCTFTDAFRLVLNQTACVLVYFDLRTPSSITFTISYGENDLAFSPSHTLTFACLPLKFNI